MFNNNFEAYIYIAKDGRYLIENVVREFGRKPSVEFGFTEDITKATFFKYKRYNRENLIVGHLDARPLLKDCRCLKVKVIQSYYKPTEVIFLER